ncbi:MAG TPA: antibiotic biosynthesis monooxygenase family protein [Alphaproteobacteria bacterium]|jgi:heme-degrading monooxygenase HmoA
MAIIRLIHVKVSRDQITEAERIWKEECAPLMIKSPGCTSEKLLKCLDEPGEFISYSEWESDDAIERYRGSAAHGEIQAHARRLQGAQAVVKRYALLG